MRTSRASVAILALTAVLAAAGACGGGGDGDDGAGDTAPPATEEARDSTTRAQSASTAAPTTEASTSDTTVAAVPMAPLTGRTDVDPAFLSRPALVVKIDNHPDAPPQRGLNQADVVYEEVVEGLTRFAAVFHSQDTPASPDDPELAAVGPVRSARTSDIDIVAGLSRPLLVWSGGNLGVQRAISDAAEAGELVDVGVDTSALDTSYFRDNRARRPHNLYANMKAIYAALASADGETAPTPLFQYRAEGVPSAQGGSALGVKLTMDGTPVEWQWNAETARWERSQYGEAHVDAEGEVMSAENVVVTFVEYRPSPADRRSPEALTVGEGEAWVFTDGRLVPGTWSRLERNSPATLLDEEGQPILLTPGRTWVELPAPGSGAVIPPDIEPAAVPFPPRP